LRKSADPVLSKRNKGEFGELRYLKSEKVTETFEQKARMKGIEAAWNAKRLKKSRPKRCAVVE
jgi:hypothetical protein